MGTLVTLTVSVGNIVFLAGTLGFILGVISLWVLAELIKKAQELIKKYRDRPPGSNRRRREPVTTGGRHRCEPTTVMDAARAVVYRLTALAVPV